MPMTNITDSTTKKIPALRRCPSRKCPAPGTNHAARHARNARSDVSVEVAAPAEDPDPAEPEAGMRNQFTRSDRLDPAAVRTSTQATAAPRGHAATKRAGFEG